jgi:hypothetical protein
LKQWLPLHAAIFGNKKIEELKMNAFVYCTARTSEQIEAIVGDLKRAGFASPQVSALKEHDTPSSEAGRIGGTHICVHVANPNQRNAAQDIFYQHGADDITTGNEAHAATY